MPTIESSHNESSHKITLGTIDPDAPGKKIKQLQPLANYLGEHLNDFGVHRGDVVIARDAEEMARFLTDGTVDLHFVDNPMVALVVGGLSGAEVYLRQWKRSTPGFFSAFLALRDSGISSAEDLHGKVIAFQTTRSAAGYLRPKAFLLERGFTLAKLSSPDSPVGQDQIGYVNAWGRQSSIDLLFTGRVAAIALGNLGVQDLPLEIQEKVVVFERTVAIPKNLVLARSGLLPELLNKTRELMTGLDQTEEGRRILAAFKDTEKFDELPLDSKAELLRLRPLVALASKD
jgi:phosphonate transport system substrate-binding protein